MTMTRKKTITIETRRRTVIRFGDRPPAVVRCEFCEAEVETATPEQLAATFELSLRDIYRSIESGVLHFMESKTSAPQICLNSLKSFNKLEVDN